MNKITLTYQSPYFGNGKTITTRSVDRAEKLINETDNGSWHWAIVDGADVVETATGYEIISNEE